MVATSAAILHLIVHIHRRRALIRLSLCRQEKLKVFHAQEYRNIGNIPYSYIVTVPNSKKPEDEGFVKSKRLQRSKNQLSAQLQPQQPGENANLPRIDTKQLVKYYDRLKQYGYSL